MSATYYGMKLAVAWRKHLEYLASIEEEVYAQGEAKQQYGYAVKKLDEHKKVCLDCTKRIAEEARKRAREVGGVSDL